MDWYRSLKALSIKVSMPPTTKANISDATNTKVALDCNSPIFGQVTSFVTSCQESLKNWTKLFIKSLF